MAGSWQILDGRRTYVGDGTPEFVGGSPLDEDLNGAGGDDQLDGAGGADAIEGGAGNDRLVGGDGADVLRDGPGIDRLDGGDGNDILVVSRPGTGAGQRDDAIGGAGSDVVELRFDAVTVPAGAGVTFALRPFGSSQVSLGGVDVVGVAGVERLHFFGTANRDVVSGGSFADVIVGGAGNDVLRGGEGSDRLESGTGIVDLDGGAGFDVASFDLTGASAGVVVRNQATVSLGALGVARNVEAWLGFTTGSGNDLVNLVQRQAVTIRSSAGADSITVVGSASLELGAGNDAAKLGAGADTVDPGLGADTVRLGGGDDQYDYQVTGTRIDAATDRVAGEAGNDRIFTASGADILDGGDGADTLFAGAGADQVLGGAGADTIQGEGGADVIRGGAGDDVIATDFDFWTGRSPQDEDRAFGDAGNDRIAGGLGGDLLDGGVGDDVLAPTLRRPGAGFLLDAEADLLRGGAGTDTLELTGLVQPGEARSVRVLLAPTTEIRVGNVLAATATGMERLVAVLGGTIGHVLAGGALDDRFDLALSSGRDQVAGGEGDDLIATGRGADSVQAGGGDDDAAATLGGADRFNLGSGDDVLRLSGLFAADGAPRGYGAHLGGSGFDTLVLDAGGRGLSLSGDLLVVEGVVMGRIEGFERFEFRGSSADERLNGGASGDRIELGAGNDASRGFGGNDTLNGGSGNDVLDGGAGNDTIVVGTGADSVQGGAGSDTITLTGDELADAIDGGAGFDRLVVLPGWAGPVVMTGNYATTIAVTAGGATVATIRGVEAVDITGSGGNDDLLGSVGDDVLRGGAGFDQLRGGAGNDRFESNEADGIDGGAGSADLAILSRVGSTLDFVFDLTSPTTAQVLVDGTSMNNVERVEFRAGAGNDRLVGGAQDDLLQGNDGADLLAGGGGGDSLDGGAGFDSLFGGAGNDRLVSTDRDTIDGGQGGADLLVLSRSGSVLAFTLSLATPDVLQVLADGTRIVRAERGEITGGSGNDALTGGAQGDVLAGGGGLDALRGGAGDDVLRGEAGEDSLRGEAGLDVLTGGNGVDVLVGGAGADRFRFESIAHVGVDRITDFTAQDFVVVRAFGFTIEDPAVPLLVAGANPVARSGLPVFLYDTDTGRLSFDADGTGLGATTALADLSLGGAVASLTLSQLLFE